ncbi:MAG: DUF3567 domain-containing protein [Pseudomonadota bacterium]|nr:DUF3567 domain-containing protein [Pseudomonadota bacterium]
MHMLYNSDSFVVVQFEVPADAALPETPEVLMRGGYEIMDKFSRKEIFIEGAMAQSFKEGVEALIETRPSGPTEDEMDAYIERYSSLMQQPVVMH